ncbi:MAG TPA: hypothetical protein VHP34_07030 [Alphaproteobacteria bacterium]|nr:hypothetical protein [Alphaproteobacteria bacterium]
MSKQQSKTEEDILKSLDKPGAGVGVMQGLVMKFYIGPFVAAKTDWDADSRRFFASSKKILTLIDGLDEKEVSQKVLVPPQRGLEDSSRYWSAAMVLEHLMIVGMGLRDIIIRLSQGKVPSGKVDTARVKPLGQTTAGIVVQNYKTFTETVADQIAAGVKDRDSKAVYAHPWFGDFTTRQWHWLLATHNDIHLQQLQAIVAGLGRKI